MSIADDLRSHAQVTPFYQVRTTQEPVYQARGAVGAPAPAVILAGTVAAARQHPGATVKPGHLGISLSHAHNNTFSLFENDDRKVPINA